MPTHPVILEYFESEEQTNLVKILEKYIDKNNYLEVVFLKLLNTKKTDSIDEELFLEIDQAVIKGHPDVNIYLFFIISSISYTLRFKQDERSKSLLSLLISISQNEVHIIIQALCLQAKAILKKIDGDFQESKALMQKSLAIIENKSPRYKMLLRNYANMLSAEGRLEDLGQKDFENLNNIHKESFAYEILEIKIMNLMIIGDFNKGYELLEEHQKKFQIEISENMNVALNLFRIVSGDLDEANYQSDEFKILARTFKSLSLGNKEETQKNYQLLQKYLLGPKRPVIDEYLFFHLEFLNGNKGKVRLMLKEKEIKKVPHYLDDLFYGRLQLLENDFEGADLTFNRLIENVNHYGAMHRLIFELQFVKEMNFQDIVLLTQGWKKKRRLTPIKTNQEIVTLKKGTDKGVDLLIGMSRQLLEVKDLVKKYAPLNAPVLITGETGSGKELVSRAIHEEGKYPKESFLAINCGALTESLLQSELFGYVAGAFTGAQKERKGIFEAAGKGTVFLDEFGDISPQLQVALLRVLESNEIRMIGSTVTRKITCRIVVATNIDLHQVVLEKKFREDLFYRLARLEIKLPALRERSEDIPILIQYFLKLNADSQGKTKQLSSDLIRALSAYHWPGNIRELKNEMERLLILNPDTDVLGLDKFDFSRFQEPPLSILKTPVANANDQHEIINEDDQIKKILQKGFPIENRHNRIKELFHKYKKLTKGQIIELTKAGHTTIGKDLHALIKAGFIVRRSPTKSTRTDYFEISTK